MGLPRIAAYSVPDPADYPDNRVAWPVQPHRAVLLIHDMQRYFVDAFVDQHDPHGPVGSAIANIVTVREAARRTGIPVVYTAQPPAQSADDRGLLGDFWGPGLPDAAAARIVPELTPADDEPVLTKWRYTAFRRTPLADVLRDAGRDQLMVVGVYAHIGCLLTAADAFMDDIQPFLIGDAVADFSAADHLSALQYAARRCARVLPTAAVLEQLAAHPAVMSG